MEIVEMEKGSVLYRKGSMNSTVHRYRSIERIKRWYRRADEVTGLCWTISSQTSATEGFLTSRMIANSLRYCAESLATYPSGSP